MTFRFPISFWRVLWVAALLMFFVVWLFPMSSRLTRTSGLVLFAIVWSGLLVLCWRNRGLRLSLVAVTLLGASFLVLPARTLPSADSLREDYVSGLRRYGGVSYYWGGESPMGIDCSGLIRRSLIDSLVSRGVRTCDPGLVRRGFSLWWQDCTAATLGEAHDGVTVHLLDTPSLQQLNHAQILPGDLAVTRSGIHIMAYLGQETWIEADPVEGRVISVSLPAQDNPWFHTPMRIARWECSCGIDSSKLVPPLVLARLRRSTQPYSAAHATAR